MPDYTSHDQWSSFLQHSGTVGMRWGYTDGHLNGNRTAQGEKEEETKLSSAPGGNLWLDTDSSEEDARKVSAKDLFEKAKENYPSKIQSDYTGTIAISVVYGKRHGKSGRKKVMRYLAVENGQLKNGSTAYDSKDAAEAAIRATATSQQKKTDSHSR